MSTLVPPFSEPDQLATGDREITARWNLGPPIAHGWQPQAILSVRHVRGHGYRATLNTTHLRTGRDQVEDDLNPRLSRVIHDVEATGRYRRAALTAAYEAAVALLRQLARAEDPRVRDHIPAAPPARPAPPTLSRSPRSIVATMVGALVEGDVFSVDGGCVWHVCAVPLFGCIAVYTTPRRDDDSLTVRVDGFPGDPCLLLIA